MTSIAGAGMGMNLWMGASVFASVALALLDIGCKVLLIIVLVKLLKRWKKEEDEKAKNNQQDE